MSFNLIDAAKGLFTSELLGKASSFLGESETGVSKAMGGIVPTVLSSMLSKSSSHEGAGALANMVQEQSNSGILNNLGGFFGGGDSGGLLNKGAGMLSGLFGGNTGGITSLLSNFAGIKSSSTTSLLSMALPAILGLVGKHSSGGASGIASLLSSQKDNIAAAMPSGLNLSSIIPNLGNLGGAVGGAKAAATGLATEAAAKGGGAMKILLPLLLLAGAAAAFWYFKDGCNKKVEDIAAPAPAVVDTNNKPATPAVSTPVTVDGKESLKVKLPNGTELDAYKGGIEDKLVAFLNTDYKALGEDSLKKIWFDFDNLNFKTGSAEFTTESLKQVDNMIAILKAYPAVKFKIGGYTDKVGIEANNVKLSNARANAVKDAITKAGVGAQVTEATGYGSQFAKYPATAPDSDRVKDRHVSASIRL